MMFPNGLAELVAVEALEWCRAARAANSIRGLIDNYTGDLVDFDLIGEFLLIGEGDGNEYIFLRPHDGLVVCWEHESETEQYPSFQELMQSY